MKIRDYPYTPEDVDCGFCALYQPEAGVSPDCCPFLRERLEAGVVGYQEAIREAVKPNPRLRRRLNRLIAAYPGTFWVSPEHKRRMEWTKAVNRYRPNANEYYAAMYLLTANDWIGMGAFLRITKPGPETFPCMRTKTIGVMTATWIMLWPLIRA